jgi:hypothetical protein
MKQFILACGLAIATTAAVAQDYKAPLKATWIAFDTTMAPDPKLQAANKLVLISKKWKDDWAPHYYTSLSKTIMSYSERDPKKHDAMLDEADKERDETVTLLGKETDETHVVAAMIANSRMMIDPQNRWQTYGKIFQENLEKAKAINADNPRMYYLKAVSTFYTPKAFGGGKKAAKPYFEKANALFSKQEEGDINKPYWGKDINNYFLAQCETPGDEIPGPPGSK